MFVGWLLMYLHKKIYGHALLLLLDKVDEHEHART